jgi:hypothetical protein
MTSVIVAISQIISFHRMAHEKKIEHLQAAVNLHMGYYNFCWRPGKMRITPAMAANVTDRLWSSDDLLAAG